MDQQAPIEDKKSFLQNDPLLVCGMLTFYGVCILVLIGAAIWGLDRRDQKISADATSTARGRHPARKGNGDGNDARYGTGTI